VEISEKDAMRYARCSERINNSGMLGIVIRLEELDDSLRQFMTEGSSLFDVTALRKELVVDVVALLLSRGCSEIYSFEIVKSPLYYDDRDLIHSLDESHDDFHYRNLTVSAPVQTALDRIVSRSIRFRTLLAFTASLGLLLIAAQTFFSHTPLMSILGAVSIAASIGSYLFPLVRDR